jgi:hypothetical protein
VKRSWLRIMFTPCNSGSSPLNWRKMPTIEFEIADNFRRDLRRALRENFETILGGCRYPVSGEVEDPELDAIWRSTLREQLREDFEIMLQFCEHTGFGAGEMHIREQQAESVLRSASAIRLFLREAVFKDVTDEQLENGLLLMKSIPEEERFYFACYMFLAGIQELLVAALMEGSDGGLGIP